MSKLESSQKIWDGYDVDYEYEHLDDGDDDVEEEENDDWIVKANRAGATN